MMMMMTPLFTSKELLRLQSTNCLLDFPPFLHLQTSRASCCG
jgi:hypothetical protein